MKNQPWPNKGPIQQIYQAAYQQALLHRGEFQSVLNKIVGLDPFEIKVDIKRFASFENKVERGKDADAIHDVLRAAILTNGPEDNDEVASRINQLFNVQEEEFKTHNDSGYRGAYHFKVLVGDMICEIQVMTKTLWAFKEVAHPGYERQKHGMEDNSLLSFTNWLYNTAQKSQP